MRVGLIKGEVIEWLAGDPAKPEREHSSAAGFTISPSISVQQSKPVRAPVGRNFDRGNYVAVMTFTTTRLFPSVWQADLWALDYDTNATRTGVVVFDAMKPDDTTVRRFLTNAIVEPPQRRKFGATIELTYTILGGYVTDNEEGVTTNLTLGGDNLTLGGELITLTLP